ncbi:hypothetical protein AN1V17_41780 [Vallitalea sediminicola]
MITINDFEYLNTLETGRKTLGTILSVTDRKVNQLIEQGIIIATDRNRCLLIESLQNYIKHMTKTDIKQESIINEQIRILQQVQDKYIQKKKYDKVIPIAKEISELLTFNCDY